MTTSTTMAPADWRDYVALARPGQWIKHVLILPGVFLALLLRPPPGPGLASRLVFGLVSAALLASANYVLNDWLDAETDRHHHSKSTRPAVARDLDGRVVRLEYLVLVAVGLVLAWAVSLPLLIAAFCFLTSGLLYNLPPIRTKDLAYLDVVTEAMNNPLRLILGWLMVDGTTLPPASIVLAYWLGGAYLMALKRFAEFRSARRLEQLRSLVDYRASFRAYTEESLLLSSFLYALLAAFFLGVFLVKYRIEYLLSLPVFALLFVLYLKIALQEDSPVQEPQGLLREKVLVGTVMALALTLIVLTLVDLPALEKLMRPHFIGLPID